MPTLDNMDYYLDNRQFGDF